MNTSASPAGSPAAATPFQEHLGGVVLEVVALVFDDGVPEPAHRLGDRLAGRLGASDELDEPVDAEALAGAGVLRLDHAV
jgi:hypothetical protein